MVNFATYKDIVESEKNEIFKKITKNIRYLVNEAKIEAHKSIMLHQHGCIIADENFNIIARGHNKYKYNNHPTTQRAIKSTLHAEIDALNNCLKTKLNNSIMIVIRLNKTKNTVKYSEPCDNCYKIINKMMKKYGLRKVYFTTDSD